MEIQKEPLIDLAENQRIETPRLWLRGGLAPVTMADANDLFEYASDEENDGVCFFPRHQSLVDTKKSPLQKRIF